MAAPLSPRSRWARRALMALRGLTLFSLLCLLVLGATAFWLHRNPQALATHLAEAVEQRTGIQCTLGAVDVVFFPVPSLGIADVRMHTPQLDFSVAFATVRPALLPLLRGQFAPGSITLLRPSLTRTPLASSGPQNAAHAASAPAQEFPWTQWAASLSTLGQSIPPELHGMSLQILHGALSYSLETGQALTMDSISTDLRLTPGGPVGTLSLGQSVLHEGKKITASLDALRLELGGQWLYAWQGAGVRARLDTRLHIPGLVQGLHLSLDAEQKTGLAESQPHWEAQASIKGKLLWDGTKAGTLVALPVAVQGRAKGSFQQGVQLEDIRLALADDVLRGQALFTQGAADQPPRLSGTLELQRLSLSQWFGFARKLPPGLQRTLHRLHGKLRFDMTPQGLDVPYIEVSAADGIFTGKGSVPQWARPVITLDLVAPAMTLSKGLPEAEGQTPSAPVFGHAPLTPEPGTGAAKSLSGPDIDYDINLRVQELAAWQLRLGETSFRCIPGAWTQGTGKSDAPAPQNGQSSALMTFGAGQIYGGRGEGQLLLSSPAPGKTGYGVKLALRNINMEPLLSRLAERPQGKDVAPAPVLLSGRLNLDTEFNAQGHTLAAFFASQEGTLQVRVDNGHVLTEGDKKEKRPFTRLRLEAKVRGEQGQVAATPGQKRLPDELVYTGQWKASLDAPRLKGAFQMEGPMSFSSKGLLPLQWRKVPGYLTLEADKSLLAEYGWPTPKEGAPATGTQKMDLSGRFSLHSAERTFAVEDAQAALPGLGNAQLKGHVLGAIPAQGAWLEGTLEGHTDSARALLRQVLPSAADSLPASTLHKAQGKARLAYRDKSLSLNDLHVKVDNMSASGWISGIWKDRPAWRFDLDVGTLDVDAYLPPRKNTGNGADKGSGKNAAAPPSWKLDWMKEWDAQGQLNIQTLLVRKLTLRHLRTPVQLRQGALDFPTLRGDLYGAPLTGSFKAEASESLKLLLHVEAQGMDMLALSTDRHMDTQLGGQGSLWATLQGTARSGADIPAALDGTWRIRVEDAFTQPRQAKGKASRSALGEIQTSGVMEKGVLRSGNLTISSPTMQARGGGWVNLDKDTLDVALTVTMYRIPEFPVRFYGSLDNPQRSINAGKAITSTLGNLGSDVVDVLGNVIGGALRFLP